MKSSDGFSSAGGGGITVFSSATSLEVSTGGGSAGDSVSIFFGSSSAISVEGVAAKFGEKETATEEFKKWIEK